jgi:mercuric reductase
VRLDLTIGGMTCPDCSRHVTRARERIEGVSAARVDYRVGTAQVELAPSVTPNADLETALTTAGARAGYTATVAGTDGTAPGSVATAADAGRVADSDPAGPADFDVFIIGTGGAGVAAAIQAAGMGARVAVVEGGTLGGTCVNVGCIPSKHLIEAAARYHAARRGFPGIAPCEPALDWPAVIRQKDTLVGDLRQAKYADVLASYPGVAVLTGRASLVGGANGNGAPALPLRVRVGDGENVVEYHVRKVIIATGGAPATPTIPGLDSVPALTSTTAMALDTRPASLLVIGGGPVGVELAQLFARFGTHVVIIQRPAQLLPHEDPTIAGALRTAL